ncbi:hypothetical protein RRG08_043797 [Elysia crispata]|uniref:Uncharacterized protein n=1 Tax=Elysia crispata TaxID=231223 RepID=A0AAE1DAG4_9GAST|nr:hypothetical protein RRG08_043797 [Elysia crispata]
MHLGALFTIKSFQLQTEHKHRWAGGHMIWRKQHVDNNTLGLYGASCTPLKLLLEMSKILYKKQKQNKSTPNKACCPLHYVMTCDVGRAGKEPLATPHRSPTSKVFMSSVHNAYRPMK